jgi:hypothetical protein
MPRQNIRGDSLLLSLTMKTFYKSVAVLFMLLLLQADLFARGGGGGHGGGHGGGGGHSSGGYHSGGFHSSGYHSSGRALTNSTHSGNGDFHAFFIIVGGIVVLLISARYGHKLLVPRKAAKAKKQLAKSAVNDKMWEEAYLHQFVHDVFMRVQRAWMGQDMQKISDILTPVLAVKYQAILNTQKREGFYNLLDHVQVKQIKIVEVKDVRFNNADTFSAYITGTITDELRTISGNKMVGKGDSRFEDLYHFLRKDNRWLLSEIDNEVRFRDINGLQIHTDQ